VELGKLRVQLSVAEEAEKDKKKDTNESNDTEEKSEVKSTDTSSSSSPLTNGVSEKVKLVNGNTSVESDTTAVNTPLGSSTPQPKLPTSSPETTECETTAITADIVRIQVQHLEKLVKFLESEFGPTRKKLNDLLENNDMKFSLLWCLFRLGSVITFKDYESGLNMAGEVCPSQTFLKIDHKCRLYASR
jgi:hypothetical protein